MIIFALCALTYSCKEEEPTVQVPEHLVVHDWMLHKVSTSYLLTKENDSIQNTSNFKIYQKTLQDIEMTYRNSELLDSYGKRVQKVRHTWKIIK